MEEVVPEVDRRGDGGRGPRTGVLRFDPWPPFYRFSLPFLQAVEPFCPDDVPAHEAESSENDSSVPARHALWQRPTTMQLDFGINAGLVEELYAQYLETRSRSTPAGARSSTGRTAERRRQACPLGSAADHPATGAAAREREGRTGGNGKTNSEQRGRARSRSAALARSRAGTRGADPLPRAISRCWPSGALAQARLRRSSTPTACAATSSRTSTRSAPAARRAARARAPELRPPATRTSTQAVPDGRPRRRAAGA